MPRLFLVRHGRPAVDPDRPAHEWPLDPAALPDVDALAGGGRLPAGASWWSSPEPKALHTARRLAPGQVTVVEELSEHRRASHWFADQEEFREVVRRSFHSPEAAAVAGWEPLARTRARLLPTVRRILGEHPGEDVVLVGHGTAWTLLVSELTAEPPDLEAWAALRMPDLWVLEQLPSGWTRRTV